MVLGLSLAASAKAQQPAQPSAEALVYNCFTCHGTDGKSPTTMPGLNGKSETYVAKKLIEFKAGKGNPTVMDRIAKGYTDEEIARVAKYFGELK
jgi:sulfide dehydrogenase cytochrome subunit